MQPVGRGSGGNLWPERWETTTGGPTAPASTLSVASWVLYDLANTIFSLGVVSLYFSLWVRDAVGPQRADGIYGSIMAVSMGMVFFLSPLLGTMSDRARTRMPFLVTSTTICVVATALLARIGTLGTIIAFVVANAAFQAGMQFYDALLPDVSTEENRGRISGIGVGVGYLGSYAAVSIGLMVGSEDKAGIFLTVAVAFLLLALPCFVFVRERGNPAPKRIFHLRDLVHSLATTITTLRQGQRYPGLSRFLLGRIFYTDAINTVVAIMTLFAVNVGVSRGLAVEDATRLSELVLLGSIGCAVVGGVAWGWLVDRLGPKRTLTVVLALWMVDFALAALMALAGLPIWVLYIVTAVAGVALGGTWASDRPLMLRLTPPDRVGEFYGFYNMVGRFSAVIGPTLWAIVARLTIGRGMSPERGQGIGIILLLVMIVVSWLIIRRVDDAPRDWGAGREKAQPRSIRLTRRPRHLRRVRTSPTSQGALGVIVRLIGVRSVTPRWLHHPLVALTESLMRRFSPLLRVLALAVSVHVGALCLPTTAYAQRSSDSVAPSPAATVHKKYPALAATLAIVPGAGHLYAGEVRRGLTVVGAIAVVSFGSALAAVGDCTVGVSSNSNDESCENDAILTAGGIVILGIWGWSIVDAGMAANRTNRRHAQAPKIAQLARMPVRVGVSHRPTPSGGETRTLTLGLRFAVR